MVTNNVQTIAEYAVRKYLQNQGFAMDCFTLEMSGNEGTLTDRQGDSMVIVYDADTKSVYIKGD